MTNLIDQLRDREAILTGWRHQIHAYPELAYKEENTSRFVAQKLNEFGLEVHTGIGRTGVVATLKAGTSQRAIGLRADMDALPIQELNDFAHRSRNDGVMHACGHDGHTAMLLGAAEYLAEHADFDGTVHFIFQPAEEDEAGARAMVDDGLFSRFPMESVYGMHNFPGVAVGQFAVRVGPQMAAVDKLRIAIHGKGGHAAMPDQVVDPILVASHVITALQSLASRNTSPTDSVVVSVTQIAGGTSFNVIPDTVRLKGTVRTLFPETRDRIERRVSDVVSGVARAFGASSEVDYERSYPATINSPAETEIAASAAAAIVGDDNVLRTLAPSMGGEDFAYMLQNKPGCYLWLGNGPTDNGRRLHSAHYDFNDEALAVGAAYWVQLVRTILNRADDTAN